MDYKTDIKAIRTALRGLCKKHNCKAVSVRYDRGTACNWIKIRGALEWGKLTEEQEDALREFGLTYGHGGIKDIISPDEREYYVRRANDINSP